MNLHRHTDDRAYDHQLTVRGAKFHAVPETKLVQVANVSVSVQVHPPPPATLPQTHTNTTTRQRKIVFCFPYNGEKTIVRKRITQHPGALFVVSESLYGHNGEAKKQLYWPLHFPLQESEYIQHNQNMYRASSADGVWAQETLTRLILGNGVRNLYMHAEIEDDTL